MNLVCLNGQFLPADQPVLMAHNKSYRYGEGIFETMKMTNEAIPLWELHWSRFQSSLQLFGFDMARLSTNNIIYEQIKELSRMNDCASLSRLRLSAFRGNGGPFDQANEFHYLIESWPLDPQTNQFNEAGSTIGIFPTARKSCDALANIKSASYLAYALAARHALAHQWDDALVINSHDRIADSSIANIFLVQDGHIITPPLSEGCVSGVMRKYLLEKLPGAGYQVTEAPVSIHQLQQADELFLTNAIAGLRWVRHFEDREYRHSICKTIYRDIIQTIGR